MVSGADFIILTKIDMVSQAELEIIEWQLKKLNPDAQIFPADGLAGYGTEFLSSWLLERPAINSLKEDRSATPCPPESAPTASVNSGWDPPTSRVSSARSFKEVSTDEL